MIHSIAVCKINTLYMFRCVYCIFSVAASASGVIILILIAHFVCVYCLICVVTSATEVIILILIAYFVCV